MNLIQAMILGIVQGVTEFLPISSSAHLLITRRFFGLAEGETYLLFDAILHLATALVITLYFFDDIKKIFLPLIQKKPLLQEKKKSLKILVLIAIATIPAVLIGFRFENVITESLRGINVIVITLVVGALLLILAEKVAQKIQRKKKEDLSFFQALVIGVFQTLALIPGMSRSGSTLSGGIFLGLSKIEATKFAFLLGLPVLYGVGGIKLLQAFSEPGIDPLLIIVGSLSAMISGYFSVKILMYVVKEKTLTWFAGYRIILAGILLLLFVL